MIPIYLSGKGHREGYSFENFSREFEAICKSHHEKGRALAFAFILYDFNNPEIAKVLNDSDYWNALDNISGRFLTVFSFHLPGKNDGIQRSISAKPKAIRGSFEHSARFVEKHFGTDAVGTTPAILFFQVTGGKVSGSYLVKLRAETVEEAFREIRNTLSDSVEAVEQVVPEFRGNTTEVFNLILMRLQQRNALFIVKRTLDLVGSVQEMIGKLIGFGSS